MGGGVEARLASAMAATETAVADATDMLARQRRCLRALLALAEGRHTGAPAREVLAGARELLAGTETEDAEWVP